MLYTVILEQEADGGYVATLPALPGCVSQGDTREEVMRNIREAADLYIEDCIAAGDPRPERSGKRIRRTQNRRPRVKLPTDVSGQELVKVLLRIGFVVTRQKGSHIVLRRGNPYARVVVSDHDRVRQGTLRQILN